MSLFSALADTYVVEDETPADPVAFIQQAGMDPDGWQRKVLQSSAKRIILCCSRQSGKSTITATLGMHTAQYVSNSLTLIGSPSQWQSAEMLRKARDIYQVGVQATEVDQNSVLRMTLANRSRLICVPGRLASARGYSGVNLLIVDEAAYVEDDFFKSVFPTMAVSRGRIVLLSTPHAKSGAFYEIWEHAPEWDESKTDDEQPNAWLKIMVTWDHCPRIDARFIQAERERFGDLYVAREYECQFIDLDVAVFARENIDAMAQSKIEQWAVF